MTAKAALALIRRRGILLESARGPVPNLAEAVAGEPIRGSWWGHPKGHEIFWLTRAVRDSHTVLVCRLVGGKVTYVHRRLWPALVRLAGSLAPAALAAVHEVHTPRGRHQLRVVPFPRWVPAAVKRQARRLSEARATAMLERHLRRADWRRAQSNPRLDLAAASSQRNLDLIISGRRSAAGR